MSALPLMGIGNLFPELVATRERLLITPHGDWKRWPVTQPASRSSSHYPSWGLETHRRLPHRRQCVPHYPSWGLETSAALFVSATSFDSLPLMGIGNIVPADRVVLIHPLITPHGDWKRGDSPALCVSATSFDSLPLMGIGNDVGIALVRVRVPFASSLPLMGIGNSGP